MAKTERRERKNKASIISSITEDVQDMKEDFATDHTEKKAENNPKEDKVAPISECDIQALQVKYEAKIRAMEDEINNLKLSSGNLSKNAGKLINAIQSEIIIQKREEPIIGRTKLIKVYKINPRYFDPAVTEVIAKGVVTRTSVKYSAKQNTFKWKILEQ